MSGIENYSPEELKRKSIDMVFKVVGEKEMTFQDTRVALENEYGLDLKTIYTVMARWVLMLCVDQSGRIGGLETYRMIKNPDCNSCTLKDKCSHRQTKKPKRFGKS